MKHVIRKRIYIKAAPVLLALVIIALALQGCASSDEQESSGSSAGDEPASIEFFAMDTYMTLSAYGENAETVLKKGEKIITGLEAGISTEIKDSEIAKLNKRGRAVLSEDTEAILKEALKIYEDTEGVFDISVYPIMKAWGFTTKKYRVPGKAELSRLLEKMDLSELVLDSKKHTAVINKKGMAVDLGGIAKGYASAKVIDLFRKEGIKSGLVNLGGNVQTLGTKPDGSLWRVAVQSPYEGEDYLGVLETADKALITSGGYERNFKKGDKTYHHIIDPETGAPADSGIISSTVVSSDGMLADALSTSLYIMGRKKASEYWRKHADEFDMILMDEEKRLYVTEGIAGDFTSDKYKVEIIKKQ